jgi:hypothetical protein
MESDLTISEVQSLAFQFFEDPQVVGLVFGGGAGGGKGLALDTKILTTNGWTTMGELKEGDYVFDKDGLPSKVVLVSDIHHRPCYKLTFSDDSYLIADDEHRWLTFNNEERFDHLHQGTVRNTQFLFNQYKSGNTGYAVPALQKLASPFTYMSSIRLCEDWRYILSIEKVDSVPTKCIMVDSPSRTYLAGETLTVTHNTFLLGLIAAIACKKYPGTRWGLARKELKSLKQTTLATLISKVHPSLGITENDYKLNLLDSTLEYVNGSSLLLLDLTAKPSDPEMESLGSLELTGAFIDEVGEVNKKPYDILASRVNRWLNKEYGITGKVVSSCIPVGGLVQTKNGYKHVENVTYEDSLLTDDGSYSPVAQIFERDANEKLHSIYYADNNLPLRLTSEHPVLVSTPTRSVKTWYENGKQKKQNIVEHNFEYRTPDKISIGDWVRVPRITEYTEVKYLWPEVKYAKKYMGTKTYKTAKYRTKMSSPLNDENFWWLVGYWLGDGWVTGNKICFACDNKYPEIKQRVNSVIKSLGRKTQFKKQVGCELLSFSSDEVAKFLRTFGHGAKNKSIPNDILHSRFGTQIVSGFIDSDGCVMNTKGKSEIEFVSINNTLLMQIQQIMFKHGIVGSLKNKRVDEFVEFRNTRYVQQPRFHLYYGFYDTKLFYNISNSVKLKSKFIASEPIKRHRRDAYADEKFIYFKIKKIDTLDYTGKVYNFETAPHNYVAGNAVVHNCNPSPSFVRQEFYDKYAQLGGGRVQKWQNGYVWVNGERLPAYNAYIRSTVLDNPFVDENYVESLRRLPPLEKRRLLDGNWDYADEDGVLFSTALIDKMTVYEIPEPEKTKSGENKFSKFIGVDPSDAGKDDTVLTLVENGVIAEQVEIPSPKGKDDVISLYIANKIVAYAQRHGFTPALARNITIEGNGVGAALRDSLRSLGWRINVYTAGASTRNDGYYQFMLDAEEGKIKLLNTVIEQGHLIRQLSAHKYDMDTGKPKVTNKKELRRTLGRSPDHADSAMIANMAANKFKPKNISAFIRW